MGLDVSHEAWSTSYPAFNRWRDCIAQAAGYQVARIKDPDGYEYDQILINWGHITHANLDGQWDKVPDDPLMVLIAHYDCQGHIEATHAALLADRLEELIDHDILKKEGLPGQPWMPKATRRFIDGCRRAAAAKERIEFR